MPWYFFCSGYTVADSSCVALGLDLCGRWRTPTSLASLYATLTRLFFLVTRVAHSDSGFPLIKESPLSGFGQASTTRWKTRVMILFTSWCCQTWTNLTSAGFLDSSHCFLLLAGNSVKNNRVESSALWMCAGDAQGKRFYLRVDFCFKLAINFSILLLGKKVFFIIFLFMCASCHHIDYQVETWFSRTSFFPYLSSHSSTNS